jgi:hypothetical protein
MPGEMINTDTFNQAITLEEACNAFVSSLGNDRISVLGRYYPSIPTDRGQQRTGIGRCSHRSITALQVA